MPRNRYLWWAIAAEIGLILLIVYTGPGNRLFATAPLPVWAWAAGLPAIAAMVVADELRKWAQRSRGKATRQDSAGLPDP